jgi:hypothetical protein
VQNGGTLGGSGIVPQITLQSGGTISPGDSPGTLSAASLLWNSGGSLAFELGNPAHSDFLNLSGALSKQSAGAYAFTFIDEGIEVGQTYDLIGFGSTTFSATDFSFTNAAPFAGNFAIAGNQLEFTPTSVPEPSAGQVLILCAAFMLRAPLRKRSVHGNPGGDGGHLIRWRSP